jgi:hypothetical protein
LICDWSLARRLVIAIGLIAGSLDLAVAQSLMPGPPGPFVIDLRGATSGVPTTTALYPELEIDASVPTRGFGFEGGAHVYLFGLGPARVGLGASYLRVRATSADATVNVQLLAPQLSFNFGTSNGWSYLSAGAGPARVDGKVAFDLGSVNAGGGARWFLNDHVGIGFDIRMHRLSAKDDFPRTTLVSASVGVSLK